ncbi:MAG: hypothetical protein ACYCZU_11690, partial [Devosia sp.]
MQLIQFQGENGQRAVAAIENGTASVVDGAGSVYSLAREAADRQGQRLGTILLADALRRSLASAETVGSSMIVVDALDEGAAAFYAA